MLELYKRIRQRREELEMSQDELARMLGYKSRSSINKIEKGENDIPQSKIVAFARALKTTPEYLMGWETSKEKLYIAESNEEKELLNGYRELNEADKSMLLGIVGRLNFARTSATMTAPA